MSYGSATEQMKAEQQEIKPFRLATVSALFEDGCPKITFFGEETPSEKKYKIIDDTSYTLSDTVLVGIVNDGYVILGSVGDSPDGGGGGTVYLTEEQANALYALKNHAHTDYASSSHSHDRIQSGSFNFRIVAYSGGPGGYYISPSSDNNCDIGSSSFRMRVIYAGTSTISTSDENKKHDIEPLDERYEKFIRLLLSIRYKFNDGSSDRFHTGFTAQQVEWAMKESGLTDLEFAGFIKSPRLDDNGEVIGYDYGLRYEEFISPMAMVLQKILNKCESQELELSDFKRRLTELEGKVNNLG